MFLLKINLLLVFSFFILSVLRTFSLGEKSWILPGELLRLSHWGTALTLILPVASYFVHVQSVFLPTLQIWSAPSFHQQRGLGPHFAQPLLGLSLRTGPVFSIPQTGALEWSLLSLFLLGLFWAAWRLVRGTSWLRQMILSAHVVKSVGGVRILIHESVSVPFSFWFPGRAYVVLPQELLTEASRYRLALLHELQHHRQGDTHWVYWTQCLRVLFFWNPFVYLLEKQISIFQEFACDEQLIVRKRVSPHAYGRCLVLTAEHCLRSHPTPIGTIGMAVGTSGKTLKRRIKMMFDYRKRKYSEVKSKALACGLGTVVVLSLTTVALASQGMVVDRRMSLSDAQKLVTQANQNSTFPIVVNAPVLQELNRYLGTPDGRDFIRDSLSRMQTYRQMIQAKTQVYAVPDELLAVPLVESGYRNMRGKISAGLWQFIESTARNFGMQVDAHQDNRMNVDVETDAAMRYLSSNYLRFQDWLLAIEAYNAGEARVQEGIDATGSRDAWKVINAGYDNDPNYLARVMAAVIILKNPSVVN